jgi:hypothetical protein
VPIQYKKRLSAILLQLPCGTAGTLMLEKTSLFSKAFSIHFMVGGLSNE